METAFNGYKWMMIFCDDESTDNTESLVDAYKTTTSADRVVYQKFEKASIVGAAKNRACSLALQYKTEYPVICFMDSDDTMGEQRISGLLPELSEDHKLVFGDFILLKQNENGEWVIMEALEDDGMDGHIPASRMEEHLTFGPWSTLALASLIPEDGVFFREDIPHYEEVLTWWSLRYRDEVNIKAVSGVITNYHKVNREGSLTEISNNDGDMMGILWEKKTEIHAVPGYPEEE